MFINSIVGSFLAVYASSNRLLLQDPIYTISDEWESVALTSYGFIKDGHCEDYGMTTIFDVQECQNAARALTETIGIDPGYNFYDKSNEFIWDRPTGCSYHKFGNVELWGIQSDCSSYDGCFCKISPKKNKIYIWMNEEVDYATANSRCKHIVNGQLATFGNQEEFLQIVAAIQNGNNVDDNFQGRAWIGLNDQNIEGKWTMIDGDLSYCDTFNGCQFLPQWNDGEPHLTEDYGEDCAVVYGWGDRGNNDGMNDISCESVSAYVCEVNNPQFF
eukprot:93321_1